MLPPRNSHPWFKVWKTNSDLEVHSIPQVRQCSTGLENAWLKIQDKILSLVSNFSPSKCHRLHAMEILWFYRILNSLLKCRNLAWRGVWDEREKYRTYRILRTTSTTVIADKKRTYKQNLEIHLPTTPNRFFTYILKRNRSNVIILL